MFVFILCVRRDLRRADPPSKVSYRLCIGLRNCKSDQGQTKDCRAMITKGYLLICVSGHSESNLRFTDLEE
jgi:hypothetical protein